MLKEFSLDGKYVLVTGASSGIGRACAIMAAKAGAAVIVTGRNEARLAETASMIEGAQTQAMVADLADASQRSGLIGRLPQLDGIVHCAGVNQLRPVKFIDAEFVGASTYINYEVPYLLTAELLKQKKLRPGTSIVFVSSISASFAMAGNSAYSGAKAALLGMMKVLAVEIAASGSRANAVSPGQVLTPMTERTAAHISADALAENAKHYPLGHGRPEDVASAVLFLLAPASRWMTGAELVLDGGYTIK